MRTVAEIQQALPTRSDTGLNRDAVEKSRARFGANRLTPLPREPLWRKFIEKFDEPIIRILLAAALLSIIVDLIKSNAILGGVALAVVLVLAATVYFTKKLRPWLPSLLFVLAII